MRLPASHQLLASIFDGSIVLKRIRASGLDNLANLGILYTPTSNCEQPLPLSCSPLLPFSHPNHTYFEKTICHGRLLYILDDLQDLWIIVKWNLALNSKSQYTTLFCSLGPHTHILIYIPPSCCTLIFAIYV